MVRLLMNLEIFYQIVSMQYTMMKYAREHGATTYNFGRTVIIQIKTLNIMAYGHLKKCGEHTK